jgi:cytochrome c-type biogenesis protein CcmH/NrfG
MSTGRSKQNPTLDRAYEALLADNLIDARRDYEQVLRSDAKNTDALLGLATIAVRQGQVDHATNLYLRVLEADPKDVTAKAGLINLKGQSDPTLSESRLKTLLASQPDSATLNFALGNLQARQTRWSDAQQAYFRAHTAEPENADYLFNLAVSLDQLHQKKLAAQYYQSALNAAETRSAAFDKNQVRSRLLELRP